MSKDRRKWGRWWCFFLPCGCGYWGYFSFIRDGMSPHGPRSINFLLKQNSYYPLQSLVRSLFQEWEKYIGLEILKRHFSRRPVKEVVDNSNFLWLSVNLCVFSLGVNVPQDFPSSTWSVSISGHVHLLPSFLPVKIFFWRHFLGIRVNSICLWTSVSLQSTNKVSSCNEMTCLGTGMAGISWKAPLLCLVLFTVLTIYLGFVFWFLESPFIL